MRHILYAMIKTGKTAVIVLFGLLMIFCCGCTEEVRVAAEGDQVSVNYKGMLDDGTVFDSSFGGEPLEFTIGDGTLISGFDTAVRGMAVGEVKTVPLPYDEAYGPYYDELVIIVPISVFGENSTPEIGQTARLTGDDSLITATVTNISGTNVTLDANHRLAGENLTFTIELVDIISG
jgi:peptidylprolyl isomerase